MHSGIRADHLLPQETQKRLLNFFIDIVKIPVTLINVVDVIVLSCGKMGISLDADELIKVSNKIKNYKTFVIIGIILFPVILGFPIFLFSYNKQQYYKKIRDKIITGLIISIRESLEHSDKIINDIEKRDTYLIYRDKIIAEACLNEYLIALNKLSLNKHLLSTDIYNKVNQSISYINKILLMVKNYNGHFVKRRIALYDNLFNKSLYPLDNDQKQAVIIDDKHNLVVAGAGSGKTEVLVNRIAYLLERKPDTVRPERIIALAFQNKAGKEMRYRLKERYGLDVKVKTFHSFGKEILEKSKEVPPKLAFQSLNADKEYYDYFKALYNEAKQDEYFQNLIIDCMQYYRDEEKTETDFNDKIEYYNYLRQLTYTTLNNKSVRSDGERRLFNYFLTHTINDKKVTIFYEKPAFWMKYKDKNGKINTPAPDFFLPEFDIYIELWAINENGNVPEWFEGPNASENYKIGMSKKQIAFQGQKKFSLIEFYQWDIKKDNFDELITERLMKTLKNKFPEEKFIIKSLTYEELVNDIWRYNKEDLYRISGDVARFVQIAKTNDLSPDDIDKKLNTGRWTYKQKTFGRLAVYLFRLYKEKLNANNLIDFTDMINLAVKTLNQNTELYKNQYDHILIDEYQDISAQRYLLIKAIMDKNPDCKLFCVGDDWQSIMGFTGSDVDYFVNFGQYFNNPTINYLKINYRSTSEIVNLGSTIIKKNGRVQLEKETYAYNKTGNKVRVIEFSSNGADYYERMAKHCVDTINELLKSGYSLQDILILTRIKKNNKILEKIELLSGFKISHEAKHDSIQLLTVHRSKGLQAKVVFVLNVIDDMYGFPCKIEDPKIFWPATNGRKKDILEEERRLFYVAITRAKEDVIIYTHESFRSKFIDDIINNVDISNYKTS